MANAIRQRIALDGSEDVKRQLNDLGNTGQEAFKKIADASNQVAAASGAAGDGALSLGEKALAAAGLIGVLATAAYKLGKAFVSAAEDAAKNAKAISDAATKSGQSLQGYQEQIAVLEKAGFSSEQAAQLVKRFGDAASEAYRKTADELKGMGQRFAPGIAGAKALEDQVAQTGVVVKNLADLRDPITQFNTALAASKGLFNPATNAVAPDIAGWQRFVEVIRGIQDPLLRAKTLAFAFGEEFGRLFDKKVIQGKTPLADFLEEFKKEGGGLKDAEDEVFQNFQKSMADLGRVQSNANRETAVRLAENLTPLIKQLTDVIITVNAEIDRLLLEATKPLQGTFLDAAIQEAVKLKEAFLSVLSSIGTEGAAVFSAFGQTISGIFSGIWAGVAAGASSMWQQIQQDAQTAVNFIVGLWERVKQAIRDVPSANNTAGAPLGDVQLAGGGYTGNRGVGRIAGVVHGQEYVQPAHVVRKPGVLAFLEILRRTGDLHAAIARFSRGYSSGGLVDSINASMARNFAIPGLRGFAGGGFVGGSTSNVTIQFPGVPDIVGLRASSDVVDQLRKAAAMAQVRSGGRKPSRYG